MNYLNIGIGSESEGLYKLARFLEDNSNKFDSSLLYELQEIVEEVDADMCELEMVPAEVWDVVQEKENGLTQLKKDIANIFTYSDDEETIEEIQEQVENVINELDCDNEEIYKFLFEKEAGSNMNSDIEKMKALGYKFKEDQISYYVRPVETEIIEEVREVERVEEPVKEKLVATVTQLDENTYSIKNREIDAQYNAQTKKFSGKGARKYKAQLLELVAEFIENNEGQETYTSKEEIAVSEELEVRDITPLTIDELFKNKPSLEESTAYFVKWYKDRKEDYGDYWIDKKAMNDLGESFLNKFTALCKDRKKLAFIGAAEKELKEMFPSFNAFQYASTIHQKAIVFEKEWNEMIEDMEKSRTS